MQSNSDTYDRLTEIAMSPNGDQLCCDVELLLHRTRYNINHVEGMSHVLQHAIENHNFQLADLLIEKGARTDLGVDIEERRSEYARVYEEYFLRRKLYSLKFRKPVTSDALFTCCLTHRKPNEGEKYVTGVWKRYKNLYYAVCWDELWNMWMNERDTLINLSLKRDMVNNLSDELYVNEHIY